VSVRRAAAGKEAKAFEADVGARSVRVLTVCRCRIRASLHVQAPHNVYSPPAPTDLSGAAI